MMNWFALFVYKLLPPVPHRRVAAGAANASRRFAFGVDDAAIFEPLQGRIQ
jgi:hypothetical protein